MKNRRRKVLGGILNHCYQRTEDGMLIFYSVSDYLVFFTLFCTIAKKYDVRILSMCLMPDHIHISIIAGNTVELSAFVGAYSRQYSHINNTVCHRKGSLFDRPFGSVPKIGDKMARANLIYVGNNGRERRLCSRTEEYRWNFLSYAVSANPYSERLVRRKATIALKRALKETDIAFNEVKPLTYQQLQRLFRPLDKREKLQLTDYIISLYNVIDYKSAIRFFGNYENMITAMNSGMGSEYDLNEPFVGRSDACYARMSSAAMKLLGLEDIHDIFLLPEHESDILFRHLLHVKDATPEQVSKFLRLRPRSV